MPVLLSDNQSVEWLLGKAEKAKDAWKERLGLKYSRYNYILLKRLLL